MFVFLFDERLPSRIRALAWLSSMHDAGFYTLWFERYMLSLSVFLMDGYSLVHKRPVVKCTNEPTHSAFRSVRKDKEENEIINRSCRV